MTDAPSALLQIDRTPQLDGGTLLVAFDGWMDGGDVSTGTVGRLVELLDAQPFAEIDPEWFYIYNFPGSMEVAALFRPHIKLEEGQLQTVEMPSCRFFVHEASNLVLFIGKEPHLRWRLFRDCIFRLARETGVTQLLFVGSFGGAVPHTREPPLYVTCSDADLLQEMSRYGVARTSYEGPGSFSSYLLSQVAEAGLRMTSLVAEIPGYLQGTNPSSILAVTRRLAGILNVSVDLDELRTAATAWELSVSSALEESEELAEKVREMEQAYDDQLLERNAD